MVNGYYSPNGVDWTPLGPAVSLPDANVYAGLAVASGDSTLLTATFDNVSLSSAADFYLATWPLSWISLPAGDTTSYALAIGSMNGFSGSVSFTITGLPNRSTAGESNYDQRLWFGDADGVCTARYAGRFLPFYRQCY